MTNELETQTEQNEPAAKKTRRRVKNVSEQTTDQPVGKVRLRLIPIWLRIIIVILLFLVAVVVGLVIGYSVLGDGAKIRCFKVGNMAASSRYYKW